MMKCPNGCEEMLPIAKKQISGMGIMPKQYKVRFKCSKCGTIKELSCEE